MRNLYTLEKEILIELYNFRGLTSEQIVCLFSIKDYKASYVRRRLTELVNSGYVTRERYDKLFYFLTSRGIKFIKSELHLNYTIQNNKYGEKKEYYYAFEMKFKRNISNHQYFLNNFIIDFRKKHKDENINIIYDKQIVFYTDFAKPDGIIETEDTIYFLEMDMNTETKNLLNKKWENYRRFYNSEMVKGNGKKIVVLFFIEPSICSSVTIQNRQFLVYQTIYSSLFDIISNRFNIYVGTPSSCLTVVNNLIYKTYTPIIKFFEECGYKQKNYDFLNNNDLSFFCQKIDNPEKKLIVINVMDCDLFSILQYSKLISISFLINSKIKAEYQFVYVINDSFLKIIKFLNIDVAIPVKYIRYTELLNGNLSDI